MTDQLVAAESNVDLESADKYVLREQGLIFNDVPTYEEWETIGATLFRVGRNSNWWLGDWLVAGEQFFQEQAAQAIDMTGLGYDAISNMRWVAESIALEERVDGVAWSLHRSAAAVKDVELRTALLIQARDELMSSRAFDQLVKERLAAVDTTAKDEPATEKEPEHVEFDANVNDDDGSITFSVTAIVSPEHRAVAQASVDIVKSAWAKHLADKGVVASFQTAGTE